MDVVATAVAVAILVAIGIIVWMVWSTSQAVNSILHPSLPWGL